MSKEEDTKFFVHLRGLKLPEEVTNRIESQIQQIVSDEIAKLDIGPKDRGLELEDDKEYRSRWLSGGGSFTAGFSPKPFSLIGDRPKFTSDQLNRFKESFFSTNEGK